MAFSLGNEGDNGSQGTNTFSGTGNGNYVVLFAQGTTAPTGVTYAGVSMTQLGSNQTHTAFGRTLNMWGLASPASGANNFVMSGGANVSAAYRFFVDADPTTPAVNPTNANPTSATPSVSVTTTVDGAYVIGQAIINAFSSVGSGTTKTRSITGDPNHGMYITTAVVSPAGTGTLNINSTGGEAAFNAVSIQPTASVATVGSALILCV